MQLLYWLESIRNPVLTFIMENITWLGHEVLPVAAVCLFYWCLNKKLGYKMAFSFFFSGLAVQSLKISFRIDRPWVLDTDFKPVDSAVGAATGYSFPSGHTQAATSLYGTLALFFKKWWAKLICVLLFLTIGFSRLYLGVHTPLDVGVSVAVTILFTVLVYFLLERVYDTNKYDTAIAAVMLLCSAAVIVYSAVLMNNGIIAYKYASDCCKSGGAGLAFAVGFWLERRYINFDVRSRNVGIHILKFAVGIGSALGAKTALKALFALFLKTENGMLAGDAIRYFVLVIWIVAIYPMIFKKIQKQTDAPSCNSPDKTGALAR